MENSNVVWLFQRGERVPEGWFVFTPVDADEEDDSCFVTFNAPAVAEMRDGVRYLRQLTLTPIGVPFLTIESTCFGNLHFLIETVITALLETEDTQVSYF